MREVYLKISYSRVVSTWKKKKGRPRNFWMQEVTSGMREKRINNMKWIDKEEWLKNKIEIELKQI